MPVPDSDRDAAETWFLRRGLPAALTPRARWRHLVPRSAPPLAAYATVVVALLVVFLVTGSSEIYIDGAPDPAERIVLAVIVLAVPLGAMVGRLVSRIHSRRAQSVAAIAAACSAAGAGVIQGGVSHLWTAIVVIAVVVALTASGAGAVLGWAVRLTMTQIAALGDLFVRSLPVLLLTVVVFFNTYVWLMASTLSRARIWLAIFILFAVTTAFLVSASAARVRPMLESLSAPHDAAHDLDGMPFKATADPTTMEPLTRAERVNVLVVLVAAQFAHLLMVAISTAGIYFVLGLVVLSPAVLAKWTGGGASDGSILGMTIPVPQSLIHMTLILCALTFMYVSARSVGDDDYKKDFLNPLVEDLHVTLIGRNRYRRGEHVVR